jgi:predicted NBD/HSP70 family sugar kinase
MRQWGVDLGGTKIECAVLENGQPLVRRRIPTEADKGYPHIISQIKTLVDAVSLELGERPSRIGFATPGKLDRVDRVMRNCNTVAMNGQPMDRDLAEALGADVRISNDANCFALAEASMGAGLSFPDAEIVFGIIMGTGVGGGLVAHGKIVEGIHGIAGEWGHNVLLPDGDACYCGKRGCIETVISGTALEKFYFEKSGKRCELASIIEQVGSDAIADETVERMLENFGRAVATLINVLDPELLVIGGGVGNVDLLYSEGIKRVERYVFNDGPLRTAIRKPVLGDSAGVFGAAALFASAGE